MFTRAEYNPRRHRVGILAMLHRAGWRGWRRAVLVRFTCGDLAWHGGGDHFSWGDCADLSFRAFIHLSYNVFDAWRAPRCELATREEWNV